MPNNQSHKFHYNIKDRIKSQDPNQILSLIGLENGMCFVDLGANDGYFSIPAAKIVGVEGLVYAIDPDAEALKRLTKRGSKNHIDNIKAFELSAEDLLPISSCADIVFIGNALHHFTDPLAGLMNAVKMLKPHGSIFNLDWKKIISSEGPPIDARLSEADVIRLCNKLGLKTTICDNFSNSHYLIKIWNP